MGSRNNIDFQRGRDYSRTVVAAVGMLIFVLLVSAFAQEPQSAGEAAASPATSNADHQPGFIHALGRWIIDGTERFKSGFQGAQDKLDSFSKQARDAAKDATGTVAALPNTRIVTGRERCA